MNRTLYTPAREPYGLSWVVLVLLFGFLLGCDTASPDPEPQTRAERWQADIEVLVETIEQRHPNPFTQISKSAFEAAADDLVAEVDERSDLEMAIGLVQLVARIGDAHTGVNPWAPRTPDTFPFRVYAFSEGLHVTWARAGHEDLLGTRLVQIGDTPADEAYEAVSTVVSHENEMWLRAMVPERLTTSDVLYGLGLLPEATPGPFAFEQDGARFERTLLPETSGNWIPATTHKTLQPRDSYYAFEYLRSERALYLQYNRCRNDPERPFASFVDGVVHVVDAQPVERLVIDLRYNGGGDSRVIQPLYEAFEARADRLEESRLYVLIGRGTFSSAVLNAIEMSRFPRTTLVGEPTGGKPNAFGEVKTFVLPYSKIQVFHSTKVFQLVPGDDLSLVPDVRVELTAADYFAGRDPVLEAALQP